MHSTGLDPSACQHHRAKALDDLVYMKDIDRGLGGRILRKGKKREDERPLSLQRWLKGSPGGDEEGVGRLRFSFILYFYMKEALRVDLSHGLTKSRQPARGISALASLRASSTGLLEHRYNIPYCRFL
jgi:hypothetical protein